MSRHNGKELYGTDSTEGENGTRVGISVAFIIFNRGGSSYI